MNKVIIVALAVIIVVAAVGVFGFHHLYKYYQERLAKPSEITPPVTSPTSDLPDRGQAGIPVTVSPTAITEPTDLEFQMTGAMVLPPRNNRDGANGATAAPQFKFAFILNTLTGLEQMYQQGNSLQSQKSGKWTVFNITEQEVLLQQYYADGSVAREHLLKLTPKTASTETRTGEPPKTYKPGEKKPPPLKTEGVDLSSPEQLEKAISEVSVEEILNILKGLPDSFIEAALGIMPPEYLRNKITESPLGLMVTDETFKNIKPAEIVNNLRKAAMDFTPKGEKRLVFATSVNPDNSPISPTDVFPPETKRIFICFRNEKPLANLDRAIIKWVNTTRQEIIYWSAYWLNPDKEYNFIYLQRKDKWETGKYLALLYKQIQDVEPAAYGEFEIK